MSSRLRAIAHDTVAIAERGSYSTASGEVSIAVAPAVAGTRLHLPDEVLSLPAETSGVHIDVTNESTLEATRRLGGDVAALNFASARNAGGGFLNGAQAQEESIARASAIYPCLRAAGDFYAYHRAHDDLTYSDRVIYSPRVPVFKDDKGTLLPQPYEVSFLTAAAPNRSAILRNQPERTDDIPLALLRRAIRVLHVAAAHGHRRLVLGAWGCGVFGNDPATVAQVFRIALRDNRFFDHVVFAVLDGQKGTPTFAAFADALTSAR
ncbi:TIGR02452 family protein [Lentzea californiensis]|uniref:TIGR02452 family protein n=1 Tax=Lentzea californiensis TaxID=438851 RepID=UPI002165DCB0|nr:TIGR02452 family protein [Lentzea californiensis]MCR3749644.1 TIGR02452 family protein [Lentzea californiensis]